MNKFFSLLRMDFLPRGADFGLLVLRVWIGLSMALLHGLQKLQNFEAMKGMWKPMLGLSIPVELGLAIFTELACSALLVLGLFSRVATFGLAFTMGVAFFVAHQAKLSGEMSGEMAFLYLAIYVALFITGPGRFSLDAVMYRASRNRN